MTSHADASSLSQADAEDGRFVVEYLRTRDLNCPLCDYNLRGISQPVCPECGHALTLSVSVKDMSHSWWLMLAVPLLLCAGIGMMCVLLVALWGMPPSPDEYLIGVIRDGTLFAMMGSIPVAIWVVVSRRRFLRLSRDQQQSVALITAGVCALAGMGFVIGMALSVN